MLTWGLWSALAGLRCLRLALSPGCDVNQLCYWRSRIPIINAEKSKPAPPISLDEEGKRSESFWCTAGFKTSVGYKNTRRIFFFLIALVNFWRDNFLCFFTTFCVLWGNVSIFLGWGQNELPAPPPHPCANQCQEDLSWTCQHQRAIGGVEPLGPVIGRAWGWAGGEALRAGRWLGNQGRWESNWVWLQICVQWGSCMSGHNREGGSKGDIVN